MNSPLPSLRLLAVAAAVCLLTPVVGRGDDKAPAAATAPSTDAALNDLKSGNQRFAQGKMTHPHSDRARIEDTSKGQKPVVTVLSCSDSRVVPEILFDQGIGDVFVVRVVGNVADTDEIGTIEYGTEHLHTPLLLVLGHTKCGAVTALVEGASVGGSIPALVSHIKPALDRLQSSQASLAKDQFVAKVIQENVWGSLEDIFKKSETVRHLVAAGKLKAVGGVYDLQTGQVEWPGQHPKQAELLTAK